MASYRLHCWVERATDLHVPRIGGWAPVVHLRCGMAEDRSYPEDILMYDVDGKAGPVFKYYLRTAVMSPLEDDVIVSVLNAKAIGKGKLGSVVVPIKALLRGVPVGFRWFKILNKKGKRVGNIKMRLLIQYPETVTLPPNGLSRGALKGFKHRGAPTLLKLGVHQVEGIEAPNGMKLNLINHGTKIQALYPSVVPGVDLDDHFWIDLNRKHIVLTFKVKRLASWIKVGYCKVDLLMYNSGEKEAHWHKILNKKDVVVGRVMLAVQMQFYHSVLVPPDCTTRLAERYQEQIFATTSTLALIHHLEESRVRHERKRAPKQPNDDLAERQRRAAAEAHALNSHPPAEVHAASAPMFNSEALPAEDHKMAHRSHSAGEEMSASGLSDAAAAAAQQEMEELERALEESRQQYEEE